MSGKWIEEYQRLSQEGWLLSQLAAFFLSIVSFLSLFELAQFFNENPGKLQDFVEEARLIPSVIFQILILVIFASRFVLLFFRTTTTFWISHILGFAGLVLLGAYWYFSQRPFSDIDFGIYSMVPLPIFNNASRWFDFIAIPYLLISPFKHFITLIFALIKPK
jgi:hypothetical protein